jgi:hypothetical protein
VYVPDERVAYEEKFRAVQKLTQLAVVEAQGLTTRVGWAPGGVLGVRGTAHVITLSACALGLGFCGADVVVAARGGAVCVTQRAEPLQVVIVTVVKGQIPTAHVRPLQARRHPMLPFACLLQELTIH